MHSVYMEVEMKIASDLIHTQIGEDTELLRAIRFKDSITGEEHLADPYEVIDAEDVDVGDEDAYRVSLFEMDPEDSVLAATYNILER